MGCQRGPQVAPAVKLEAVQGGSLVHCFAGAVAAPPRRMEATGGMQLQLEVCSNGCATSGPDWANMCVHYMVLKHGC
jgi:hypothetical protein